MVLFLEDAPDKQYQGDRFNDHEDLIALWHLAGTGVTGDLPVNGCGRKHIFPPGT